MGKTGNINITFKENDNSQISINFINYFKQKQT